MNLHFERFGENVEVGKGHFGQRVRVFAFERIFGMEFGMACLFFFFVAGPCALQRIRVVLWIAVWRNAVANIQTASVQVTPVAFGEYCEARSWLRW